MENTLNKNLNKIDKSKKSDSGVKYVKSPPPGPEPAKMILQSDQFDKELLVFCVSEWVGEESSEWIHL